MRIMAILTLIIFSSCVIVPTSEAARKPGRGISQRVLQNLYVPRGLRKSSSIEIVLQKVAKTNDSVVSVRSIARRLSSLTKRFRSFYRGLSKKKAGLFGRFKRDHKRDLKTAYGRSEKYGYYSNRRLINGDPKMGFHRSENKMHSAQHQPEPTPEPTPDPTTIDLSTWNVVSEFIDSSGLLNIYFVPDDLSSELYDYILVLKFGDTGEVISAEGTKIEVVTEEPSVDGMKLLVVSTASDGSIIKTYVIIDDGSADFVSVTTKIVGTYNADGTFREAEVTTVTQISPDEVSLP